MKDGELYDWLNELIDTGRASTHNQRFAEDLIEWYDTNDGQYTDKQRAAIKNLITRYN